VRKYVTTDPWIARLYVIAQIVALSVCGVLVALGRDSAITDIFIASAGALLGTSGYTALKGKGGPP
jgi:predicted lysophospholipase L1 biosynthesis ABC-type transport system permease subunit